MKKLLYLLLVVPFLFLLISCGEKKSQEEKDFEKALYAYSELDEDYLSDHAIVMVQEMDSVYDGVPSKSVSRVEMYKNSIVATMRSITNNSIISELQIYGYLEFKNDDIILYQLSDDEYEAKENGKIYQYGEKILYETNEEGDSLNETLEEISDMSFFKYSDFKKVDNKYSLKKSPTKYKVMGADVSITECVIEVDDNGYLLNYQFVENVEVEFSGITTYSSFTANCTVDRDATVDKYIQEAVKDVK
ncbi:MAG: hypothetical protein K5892_01810 [Acholeplasmatales bacterium]|nr:hypothetical protein [Acholeplasmatales bacterium]